MSLNLPTIVCLVIFLKISSITTIGLSYNRIRGILPSTLGVTLPNLRFLGLAYNHFTGSVPISITNASNLEQMYLNGNQFTGEMLTLERLHKLF